MRAVAITIALCGCVVEDVEESTTTQDVVSTNGTSVNGTSVNGTSVNGTSVNGTSVNGTSVNGTSVNGTTIKAVSSTGTPISGTSAVGSKWTATTSNGTTITLRIDSALQGSGTNADLWFYGVSYQNSTGWYPLCGSTSVLAVTVAGVWDASMKYMASSTQFTWACRGATIAKCVELGYKTFKGRTNQLASCTRMLRGDYCGTGVAYTVDGQLVNLYDNIGVQLDTESWPIEGEWAPSGATCVTNAGYTRFAQAGHTYPPCLARLQSSTCGKFRTGTYLLDELPPIDGSVL